MRKYIILFLLWGVFGNAQYNLFARQNFAKSVSASPTYNTYIGGVSGTIASASALATKLGIDVSKISNFTIVGSDIKCKIIGSYVMIGDVFNSAEGRFPNILTYYYDNDSLVTATTFYTFYGQSNFYDFKLNGLVVTDQRDFEGTSCVNYLLPNMTTNNLQRLFRSCYSGRVFYIPRCTKLGNTVGSDNIFDFINSAAIIYCHPSLATCNAGAPDGDLAYAITQGATVRYVTNFTAPSPVTTLAVGTVYNTAIQLNFTPPSSTNAIDYYEVYANGVFKNNISASGGYVTGLTAGTSYDITVYARDVFYNKSLVSNTLTQSTDNYSYTDADANASISAKSLTGSEQESEYLLITGLKSNSLYAKCQAIYTFKGTTAAQHKFNSKNPLDTDAAFRLTFTGAATFSNLGYQLNGSSYANTYFAPSSQQTLNSNGITVVCGTNNTAFSSNVVEVGAYNGANQASYLMVKNNSTNYKRRTALNAETSECSQSGINESRGIFTGTKQSSTVTDLFINGSQVATANQSSGVLSNLNIYIGALNFSNSAVTHSNQRIQIVIFHEGWSDAETATAHSIIDLSEAIAGRKTW